MKSISIRPWKINYRRLGASKSVAKFGGIIINILHRIMSFQKPENGIGTYNISERMPDEMCEKEPMVTVFNINKECDVAGIFSGIMRKLSKQSPVNDDGQRVVTYINAEKRRVFIKIHVLDEHKLNEFLSVDNPKVLG
jgi:hypothetical protein